MATSFFGGGFFGGEFFNPSTPPVPTPEVPRAGGDSTRRRRRRPMYYWEAARLARATKDEVAEEVADVVAEAYTLENPWEFAQQVNYLQKIQTRLQEAPRFEFLVEQVQTALTNLRIRQEQLAADAEEAELVELLQIEALWQ